jgi:Holliday junction resolvase RusA-like endonuclease
MGILRARLGKRRMSFRIVLSPRDRRCDHDNLFKSVLDSLVHAGLLREHRPDWLEPGPVEYV